MRWLLLGCLLLAGCDRKERQVSDCTQSYGNVPGGVQACLEAKGWSPDEAAAAELRHSRLQQGK